ncbi:nitrous oxide reductase accessory protein NosL [Salinimicrobium xinjiangense]|uniref:nitrous oxide reductase accessory protein NosL n=1 Tax=Salinimicrobium xinjiangense TaxID=438596 RepID=UPI00040D35C5|nr:nitrous oxide reductase accessory protein NosL [Salinimicrobium xinjiangense]
MKDLFYLLFVFTMLSCSTQPEPINYGTDACSYCEMTIVDKSFSAQAVTEKGKQFKFDAIECLINHQIQNNTEMATQQVADFTEPGTMIEVETALFIKNDTIKSPMGENLAALKKEADKVNSKSADVYSWNEIVNLFRGRDSLSLNN